MGHTILPLADKKLSEKAIFNNRFVVEIAETVHVHYRNLRINLSMKDWVEMAEGMRDALKRWTERGKPNVGDKHIELCRKEVATAPIDSDYCKVNLNKNLYLQHEGKIFAEGAEFEEPTYVHLKLRDLRIELSKEDFKVLAEAVKEASDAV